MDGLLGKAAYYYGRTLTQGGLELLNHHVDRGLAKSIGNGPTYLALSAGIVLVCWIHGPELLKKYEQTHIKLFAGLMLVVQAVPHVLTALAESSANTQFSLSSLIVTIDSFLPVEAKVVVAVLALGVLFTSRSASEELRYAKSCLEDAKSALVEAKDSLKREQSYCNRHLPKSYKTFLLDRLKSNQLALQNTEMSLKDVQLDYRTPKSKLEFIKSDSKCNQSNLDSATYNLIPAQSYLGQTECTHKSALDALKTTNCSLKSYENAYNYLKYRQSKVESAEGTVKKAEARLARAQSACRC